MVFGFQWLYCTYYFYFFLVLVLRLDFVYNSLRVFFFSFSWDFSVSFGGFSGYSGWRQAILMFYFPNPLLKDDFPVDKHIFGKDLNHQLDVLHSLLVAYRETWRHSELAYLCGVYVSVLYKCHHHNFIYDSPETVWMPPPWPFGCGRCWCVRGKSELDGFMYLCHQVHPVWC